MATADLRPRRILALRGGGLSKRERDLRSPRQLPCCSRRSQIQALQLPNISRKCLSVAAIGRAQPYASTSVRTHP